jgi:nucleoside 2-deoxyribosyltransferase
VRVYFAGPLFTPYERDFIDECAARLRAEGFEVFVPHEQALAIDGLSSDEIFRRDAEAVAAADVLVALLDGPSIDDGTACEIGLFHGLARSDPAKRGVIGLLTDFRGGLNLFVRGCLDEVVAALRRRS